jgi:putative DNA primase/helicase
VLETAKDLLQPLPSPDPRLLAFSNGVLNLDTNQFSPHSPSNFISEAMPVKYDPDAKCDLFLKMFLANVLEPADVDLLQRYLSQLLQGINHSQAILILNGDAGWGKSSLMKIIGSLLGWRKVGIIRPQLFEDEFELAHYSNKHLLYCPDMPTSFLDCPEASVFKNLVGGDPLWADVRGNRLVVQGQFPVVLSCNGLPKIDLDQDAEAWNRRLVVLSLKAPDHNKHFGKMADLLLSEASGILNWLLEGRAKLLKDKLQLVLNDEQRTRTEKLLLASDSPSMFVKSCLVRKDGDLGVMELFTYYQAWCSKNIVPPISSKAFTRIARAQIEFQFGLRFRHDVGEEASNRGWKGVGIAQT